MISARKGRRGGRRTGYFIAAAGTLLLACGVMVPTTTASWSDSAAIRSGGFSLGTVDVDLKADGGGSRLFDLRNFKPGVQREVPIHVTNLGTLPIDYSISATVSGDLKDYIVVTTLTGGTGQLDPGGRAQPVLLISWKSGAGTPPPSSTSGAPSSQVVVIVDAVNRVRS